MTWTLQSDKTWAVPDKLSGTGDAIINVEVAVNTSTASRTAIITATDGTNTVKSEIIQAGTEQNYLTVNPTALVFDGNGGSKPYTVTSNIENWVVEVEESARSWCSVNKTVGSGNDTIVVTASSYIVDDEIPEYLIVSPSSLTNIAATGSQTFTIQSNAAWQIINVPSWVTLSATSGTGDTTITVIFNSENTDTSSRTQVITIKSTDGTITKYQTLTQSGAAEVAKYLAINPISKTVNGTAGTTTVAVVSNTDWEVTNNIEFATLDKTSGSGDGTISISYLDGTVTERSGTLDVLTTDSSISQTFTLTQGAASSEESEQFELMWHGTISDTVATSSAFSDSFILQIYCTTAWELSTDESGATFAHNSGSMNLQVAYSSPKLTDNTGHYKTFTITLREVSSGRTATVTHKKTTQNNVMSNLYDMTYGNGIYAIAPGIYSMDFSNWNFSRDMRGEYMAFGNNVFVTAQSSLGYISITSNFVDVTTIKNPFWSETESYDVRSLNFLNDKFIITSGGKLATSSNGLTWELFSTAILSIVSTTYMNGVYYIIGHGTEYTATLGVSTDLVNWTYSEIGGYVDTFTSGNDKLIGIIRDSENISYSYVSSDKGVSWNKYQISGNYARTYYDLTYESGIFWVIDNAGVVTTTTDGEIWTQRIDADPGVYYPSACGYLNGYYCATLHTTTGYGAQTTYLGGRMTYTQTPDSYDWQIKNIKTIANL